MRLLANQLRDVTNAVRASNRDKLFDEWLKDCLQSAMMGRDHHYIDIDEHKLSKEDLSSLLERFNNFHFKVEHTHHKDDGYYDITVRW